LNYLRQQHNDYGDGILGTRGRSGGLRRRWCLPIGPELRGKQIVLFFLPGDAPELNPDELLNGDIKRAVSQVRLRDRQAMKAASRNWLHRRQKQPAVRANLFHAPQVRYPAA